jgi:hypothetical protein
VSIALLCVAGVGGSAFASVVLVYPSQDAAASANSPFGFVNGANYATLQGSGFVTTSYSNAQQLSVSVSASGADGAYGTYLLDVFEVQARVTSATTWSVVIAVGTPLTASGVNAAYLFYCTVAPGAVPASGTPLASGVGSNGNPWAVLAPACGGVAGDVSLLTSSAGTVVTILGTVAGTSILYCSLALDVSSSGASTTTPASVAFLANA